MKIVICGSMAFSKEMVEIAGKPKQNNHEVIIPYNAEKYADGILTGKTSHESTKDKIDKDLIRDYFNEIKNADAILIVNFDKNGVKNYVGGNSFLEMGFAYVLNKPIFLLNDIPSMSYDDEVKAMQPVILNGDLFKIVKSQEFNNHMEEHLKKRPQKKVFQKKEIDSLRNQAIEKIKLKLLPDEKIVKIILIGSSVKNIFGKYEPPGFRGSLFSDFDFIVFVEDDFEIPEWLDREPNGKPFPDDELNLAYRTKNFIKNKYDAEIFFVRRSTMNNPEIEKIAEMPGCEIPFSKKSKWKHIVVYSKD